MEDGATIVGDTALLEVSGTVVCYRRVAVGEAPYFREEQSGVFGVPTPRGGVDAGRFGGEAASREAEPSVADDVRTTWIERDRHKMRWKSWRDAVADSTEERFGDFPSSLSGAPQALHFCRQIARTSGNPSSFFESVRKEINLGKGDKIYHDVKAMLDMLEHCGCYDQLNLGGLAVIEALVRRLLATLEANAKGVHNANWTMARHITGSGSLFGDLMTRDFRDEMARRVKNENEADNLRQKSALGRGSGVVEEALIVGGLPSAPSSVTAAAKAKAEAKPSRRERVLARAAAETV